jgi:catalase
LISSINKKSSALINKPTHIVMNDQEKQPITTGTKVIDWYDQNGEAKSNNYPQLGSNYRQLSDDDKNALTENIIGEVKQIDGPDKEMAVNLQLCHWFRTDMGLGMAVASGLNINLQDLMKSMQQ